MGGAHSEINKTSAMKIENDSNAAVFLPARVRACVRNMAGDVMIEELMVPMDQKVLHMKALIQDLTGIEAQRQQLLFGTDILPNEAFISSIGIKDGDELTLLQSRLPTMLNVKLIDDSVQVHGMHKLALQSEPLEDMVEKIEVRVQHWEDQDWGGKQARLFIYLHDPADNDRAVASLNLFGCLRTAEYDLAKHKQSPSRTVDMDEEVVSLAKPGMVYKLKYQLGGGGGHTIRVKDWKCNVFPPGCSNDEPLHSIVVNRVGESGRAFDRNPKVGPTGHRKS